ncbi:MAG: hypothetical protein NVSMB42_15590 [Herpetosiphon sp.]
MGPQAVAAAPIQPELYGTRTELLALLADGRIRPKIARCLPLEQAAKALGLSERGPVSGKVLLIAGQM